MGSWGGSQQQAENWMGSLSPMLPLIGQMLGLSPTMHKGSFQWGGNIPDFMGPGGVLENFDVSKLFDPARVPTPQVDVGGALGGAEDAFASMGGIARGGGVDEDVNLANIILTQRQLPALKEEMGAGLGLGPGDSDFNARLADIMGQNAASIASLGTERKMQAGQLMPSMAGNLLGLEGAASQVMTGRDPTRSMLSTIRDLAGFGTQAGGLGQSQGESWQGGVITSDRRLKHDIVETGTSPSGIPIYSFRYLSEGTDGPVYTGTMAQDLVEMDLNQAVLTGSDGMMAVNYDLIDVDFRSLG